MYFPSCLKPGIYRIINGEKQHVEIYVSIHLVFARIEILIAITCKLCAAKKETETRRKRNK